MRGRFGLALVRCSSWRWSNSTLRSGAMFGNRSCATLFGAARVICGSLSFINARRRARGSLRGLACGHLLLEFRLRLEGDAVEVLRLPVLPELLVVIGERVARGAARLERLPVRVLVGVRAELE